MAKRRRKRKSRSKRTALTILAVTSLTAIGVWILWRVSQPAPPEEFRFPTPMAAPDGGTPEIQASERARLESILEGAGGRGDAKSR